MEDIYSIKESVADITIVKNYSSFPPKRESPIYAFTLEKKEKHRAYFCSDDNYNDRELRLNGFRQIRTKNNDKIKRYFNNPFARVTVTVHEQTIKKDGDKVYVKYNQYQKTRGFNRRYFKKNSESCGFVFNLKTGNFTVYSISKKYKKIRVNDFYMIRNIISRFFPSDDVFFKHVNDCINLFDFKIDNIDVKNNTYLTICETFIKLKKIKAPDKYQILLCLYPTEKFLKKNDRKLSMSVLDMLGIKNNYINKLVHLNNKIVFQTIMELKLLFGKDFNKFIPSINVDLLALKSSDPDNIMFNSKHRLLRTNFKQSYQITKKEKENIVKILNSGDDNGNLSPYSYVVNWIYDHFDMISKLKEYNFEVNPLSSTTYETFIQEHNELSARLSLIRKGYYTEFIFDEELVKDVEEPIMGYENEYIPVLLKNEKEYIEEGEHMHHCVASYADRNTSTIISLRKKGTNERVTSEFVTFGGQCQQSRYFYNRNPPDDFLVPLEMLKSRIQSLSLQKRFMYKEKKYVSTRTNEIMENVTADNDLPF